MMFLQRGLSRLLYHRMGHDIGCAPTFVGKNTQQPVKKLWTPPFHQKPGADEARRRRIPFMGL